MVMLCFADVIIGSWAAGNECATSSILPAKSDSGIAAPYVGIIDISKNKMCSGALVDGSPVTNAYLPLRSSGLRNDLVSGQSVCLDTCDRLINRDFRRIAFENLTINGIFSGWNLPKL